MNLLKPPNVFKMQVNKQLTIPEAIAHIKQNIAPFASAIEKAETFDEGFVRLNSNTVTARKLGEIELKEPIVDTSLFLRQITMAMYPNRTYPAEWLNP